MAASLYTVQNQGDGIYQGIKGIVNDLKIDTKQDFSAHGSQSHNVVPNKCKHSNL